LYVLSALIDNKETRTTEAHQSLLAKTAFILERLFATQYQERALSVSVVSNVLDSPPNPSRSELLLFASKFQLLEGPTNDATLPLAAADLFRANPEKCYDDLFARFKADPLFGQSLVHLVSCAHNTGMAQQDANWAGQGLDLFKLQLHEPEEKVPAKKANVRDSKLKKGKAPQQRNTSKAEPAKDPIEEVQNAAAVKIQTVWNRCRVRTRNVAKFFAINKWELLSIYSSECVSSNRIIPQSRRRHSNPNDRRRGNHLKNRSHTARTRDHQARRLLLHRNNHWRLFWHSLGRLYSRLVPKIRKLLVLLPVTSCVPSLVSTRLRHIFSGQRCIAIND
jgi:hypothetical protein